MPYCSPYVFLIGEDDDCPGVVGFQQLLDGFVIILQLGVVGNFQRLGDADSTFFYWGEKEERIRPPGIIAAFHSFPHKQADKHKSLGLK